MKRNSPFGVGRLMRAVICGLLAATVLPSVGLASSQTFSVPFTTTVENTCVFPSETVVINGVQHTTFDTDTGKSFMQAHGTGFVPVTGVKYTLDDSIHNWVGDGPGDSVIWIYDYRRVIRQGNISSPLGGDDFFVRIFFQFPTGGRPDVTNAGCQ